MGDKVTRLPFSIRAEAADNIPTRQCLTNAWHDTVLKYSRLLFVFNRDNENASNYSILRINLRKCMQKDNNNATIEKVLPNFSHSLSEIGDKIMSPWNLGMNKQHHFYFLPVLYFFFAMCLAGCTAIQPSSVSPLASPSEIQSPQVITGVATEATTTSSTPTTAQIGLSRLFVTDPQLSRQSTIVFSQPNYPIYVFNIASDNVQMIKDIYASSPMVTTSGYLYYLSNTNYNLPVNIYRMRSDGSNREQITNGGVDWYAVTQNGSTLAFTSSNTIKILSLGENGRYLIGSYNQRYDIRGLWSADGLKLAYISRKDLLTTADQSVYHSGDLYVYDIQKNKLTQLTSNIPVIAEAPTWSPSGNEIAFLMKDDQGINLYTIDVNSTKIMKLTNSSLDSSQPIWSPNAERILFIQGSNFCTIQSNGEGFKTLEGLTPQRGVKMTAWSPDGKLVSLITQKNGSPSIDIVNPDDGNDIQLFPDLPFADTILDNLSWVDIVSP
jgi:Tol biopolymer transport system component